MTDTGKKLSVIILVLLRGALLVGLAAWIIGAIAAGWPRWPTLDLILAIFVSSLVQARFLISMGMGRAVYEDEPVAMWRAKIGEQYIDFILTRTGDYRWTIPAQWSNDIHLTGSIAEEALGQLEEAMGRERSFAPNDYWSSSISWTPELPSGQPPN